MISTLTFLAPSIAACILLSAILGYYGNHILTRGIIFIDIAVAQIAALGTLLGILIGFAEESGQTQFVSYGFTTIAITVFSLTKTKKQIIPQEAIIGIFYCIALGIALLLAEKIPGGSNFITKTITGNILWVTWKNILSCFLFLAVIAAILIFLDKRLKEVTFNSISTESNIKRIKLLDVLFYISFGFVIVKAVPILGIFLVFILLIAPAAIMRMFTQNWKKQLIWSWIAGSLGSIIGIYLSYSLNISNGPAIVCLLGITVFIICFYKLLFKSSAK
ncbi:metal ABC transporter permease [Bacteroidota bacterium]